MGRKIIGLGSDKTHSYLKLLFLSGKAKNPSAGIYIYKEHLTETELAAEMFGFSLS